MGGVHPARPLDPPMQWAVNSVNLEKGRMVDPIAHTAVPPFGIKFLNFHADFDEISLHQYPIPTPDWIRPPSLFKKSWICPDSNGRELVVINSRNSSNFWF